MRKVIAASFRWPGGKSLLSPQILKHVPKRGRKFVEPFAGRANVFFRAVAEGFKYQQWLLNDPLTAPFLRAVRNVGSEVAVPPRTGGECDIQRGLAEQGDEKALCLEPWLVFNGGTYQDSSWSSNGGRRTTESYRRNLLIAHKAINDAAPRITEFDWLNCLEAEQLGPEDFVFLDPPYIDCQVAPYKPDSIVPTELISYLHEAPFQWVLSEYKQPVYIEEFGEPIYTRAVRNRATNVISPSWQPRTECLWTNIGKQSKAPKRCTATLHAGAKKDYKSLPTDELLNEIAQAVKAIEANQVATSVEIRSRLMPALIALRARLKRKKPGYYETLEKMGLSPSRVRSWFYRGRHAEETIQMLEREREPAAYKGRHSTNLELTDEKDELLRHADRMAAALLKGKVKFARRLASEYASIRKLMVSESQGAKLTGQVAPSIPEHGGDGEETKSTSKKHAKKHRHVLTNVHFSSDKDYWETPAELFNALHSEFRFTTDVCAQVGNAKLPHYFDKEKNGLEQQWTATCWMNPPYGRAIEKWMKKAYESSLAGATVVCLVPARTDTQWWKKYCTRAAEIRFITGRVHFSADGISAPAPFPSVVVIFTPTPPQNQIVKYVEQEMQASRLMGLCGPASQSAGDSTVVTQ